MKKILGILLPVLLCFFMGASAGYIQSDSIREWYPSLIKSPLTPPNYVFPIVWGILYLCMGVSIGLIINSTKSGRRYFMGLFAIQLLLNFSWSVVFFYFQNPFWGMLNIIALDILIINYSVRAYSRFKTSSLLFLPYIVWVTFAAYLNLYILNNN